MRYLSLTLCTLFFANTCIGRNLRHPAPKEKKYIAIVKSIPEIRKEIDFYRQYAKAPLIVFVDHKEGHTYYVNVSEDLGDMLRRRYTFLVNAYTKKAHLWAVGEDKVISLTTWRKHHYKDY